MCVCIYVYINIIPANLSLKKVLCVFQTSSQFLICTLTAFLACVVEVSATLSGGSDCTKSSSLCVCVRAYVCLCVCARMRVNVNM